MMVNHSYFLLGIGFLVGTLGTLVGAGGGFVLMPILFWFYPDAPPEQLTAVSLSVVFFNALSGSIAYARKRRIDYRSGILFSLATVPGAVLGATVTSLLSRQVFEPAFSVALMLTGGYLAWCPQSEAKVLEAACKSKYPIRHIQDSDGNVYHLAYNLHFGIILSVVVGFISSVLGIGGGIIHVPALVQLLQFPVHVATATSHFILAIMAFVGAMVHLWKGDLAPGFPQIAYLAPSVAIGAQLGASLSHRIHGKWIIRGLALALVFLGMRLLVLSFGGQ